MAELVDPADAGPFDRLDLALTSALTAMGVLTPTSIQRALHRPMMDGSDVIAVAATGSGKTLAYLLPILQRWVQADTNDKPGTVMIVPTRELARQAHDVVTNLSERLPWLKLVTLHGGVSINPQLMALRGGADIVIATPGRLMDVIRQNGIDISRMKHLVLDEADRLLDEGFTEDIETVMRQMAGAQTLLVSATFPANLRHLSARMLKNPVFLDEVADAGQLVHRAIEVDRQSRTDVLIHVLRLEKPKQVLIFTSRHIGADKLAVALGNAGLPAWALHGKLSQSRRTKVMNGFRSGEHRIVVATDLAARGLDVPGLPVVVNFDLPRSTVDYLHRAGRSGRAGQAGHVISLVDADGRAHMSVIEKRCNLTLSRERIADFMPVDTPVPRQRVGDANGGIKGRRPSKKDRLRAARAAEDPPPE